MKEMKTELHNAMVESNHRTCGTTNRMVIIEEMYVKVRKRGQGGSTHAKCGKWFHNECLQCKKS